MCRLRLALDCPFPLNGTKTMVDRGLHHYCRPKPAYDAGGSDTPDVCLFADVIMPSAERTGNDRPITLLTRKRREMKIICFGICSVHQGSIPGHRRPGSRLDRRTIIRSSNLGHRPSSKHYASPVLRIISFGSFPSLSKSAHLAVSSSGSSPGSKSG